MIGEIVLKIAVAAAHEPGLMATGYIIVGIGRVMAESYIDRAVAFLFVLIVAVVEKALADV